MARALESTQASIEAALGAGARRAAVAFSGGKDSCAVLDLAVRAFDEVTTFTFVLLRGLECSRPVLEYPVRKYGLAPSVELLHPAVGEYLREGWYSDTSERTDAIPTYSMIQAYDHARLSLGADVVCDGNKDADGEGA